MASVATELNSNSLDPFVSTWNGRQSISSDAFLAAFNKYDKDGNGYIEGSEIDFFMADIMKNQKMLDGDIKALQNFKQRLLRDYDKNNDQRIELTELSKILPTEDNFLLQFRLKCVDLTSIEFMNIWKHYDTDGDGYLTKCEIQGFCYDLLSKKKGRRLKMEAVKKFSDGIVELYDTNKDGKLNIRELQKLLPVEKNYLSKIFQKQKSLTEKDFDLIFKHYDQNDDGSISEAELEAFVRDLVIHTGKQDNQEVVRSVLKDAMKHIDKNKDGKIQRKELSILFTNRKVISIWK